MSYRIKALPPGVEGSSPWPYEKMPRDATTEGDWKMGMSGGGSMVIWPAQHPFPDKLNLIEAFRGSLEQLKRFQGTFCMLGYEKDPLHEYQDDNVWLFNWSSGTLAQIYIAGQIAKLLFDDEYEAAWALGHSFEERIRSAEDAARS